MKMSYKNMFLAMASIAALGLAFGIGYFGARYFTHRGTTSNSANPERKIGVRLTDPNGNNEIDRLYLCFDTTGDGKFDALEPDRHLRGLVPPAVPHGHAYACQYAHSGAPPFSGWPNSVPYTIPGIGDGPCMSDAHPCWAASVRVLFSRWKFMRASQSSCMSRGMVFTPLMSGIILMGAFFGLARFHASAAAMDPLSPRT